MTERMDFLVHHRGNNSVRTERSGTTWLDTQSAASCHVQRGSRVAQNATRRVWSMMNGLDSASDLYARAQWSGRPDASGQ